MADKDDQVIEGSQDCKDLLEQWENRECVVKLAQKVIKENVAIKDRMGHRGRKDWKDRLVRILLVRQDDLGKQDQVEFQDLQVQGDPLVSALSVSIIPLLLFITRISRARVRRSRGSPVT